MRIIYEEDYLAWTALDIRVVSGRMQFGRIIVFNAILFGVGVHSALKSHFTFACFLVNEPASKRFRYQNRYKHSGKMVSVHFLGGLSGRDD
jgi:hypothetical protein